MGLYLPGDGLLHRWHPLTKLAFVFTSFLLVFANLLPWKGFPLFPWIGVLFLFILALLNGKATFIILMRRFMLFMLPLFLLFLLLLLVQALFFSNTQGSLWQIGPFSLEDEGLLFGGILISRLALILQSILLLLLTTHPTDLAHALTQVGVPRAIAYIILTIPQLIPRLQSKAQRILNAQQARGLRTEGNLMGRLRALLPLIAPLINSALQETEKRALALEVRAFHSPSPKTSWRPLHDSLTQRLARWMMIIGAVAVFVWARMM